MLAHYEWDQQHKSKAAQEAQVYEQGAFAFGYSSLVFTFTETNGTSHKGNFGKPRIFLV